MCGIVGVYARKEGMDVREILHLALFSLQHRGQEAAGFVLSDGQRVQGFKDLGSVEEVFHRAPPSSIPARIGVAHTRYTTAGGSKAWQNAQPLWVYHRGKPLVIAHNGHLHRAPRFREEMEARGEIFFTTSDTEVFLRLFTRTQGDPPRRLGALARQLPAAYSMVLQEGNRLMAFRDPFGFRPLVMADYGDFVVFASERGAFYELGEPPSWEEIAPGEVVWVEQGGTLRRARFAPEGNPAPCVFELIYFSRPDHHFAGVPVYAFRERAGELLARRETRTIDVVVPVPDSGLAAAMGYARALGRPLRFGLVRSHYAGRTFIRPSQGERVRSVRRKLIPVREVLEGRSVAVVDDSIVRGTTSRRIVELLRAYGAREVHFRVASPPIIAPCFYGIDIPTYEELVAHRSAPEAVAQAIGADSVLYLTVDDLKEAAGREAFCFACFSDRYPEGSL